MLNDDVIWREKDPTDDLPLTPEEALALFRGALGGDTSTGLLLGVSGGPDSIAMMGLAGAIRAFLPPIAIATVDHQLRPEAREEAEAVAEFAKDMGFHHCILPWTDHPRNASQEAARKGRYALLVGHARAIEASHFATGHTLDDQAETVLLRLSAGTGTAGLAAMRPNIQRGAVNHIRPFLEIPKSRILATCRRHGWLFVEDPSNLDSRFKRVRLRALMPMLANEGLTPERLGTLAARARRTDDAIEHVAKRNLDEVVLEKAPDGGALRLQAGPFLHEPFELSLRMLRRAMMMIAVDTQGQAQIQLSKLEVMLRNLRMAIRDDRPFRRTLAWAVIAYASGYLEVRAAPARRQQREHDRNLVIRQRLGNA